MFDAIYVTLAGYLFGSIPTAIIAGKMLKKIDIREHGSGNAGATNVFRILGPKAGIIVLLIDMLKGFIPVFWIAGAIHTQPDTLIYYQMLAAISEIIPGAERWPGFVQNLSEQFEARLSLVEVLECPSVFLRDMAGSRLLIATSHGEGRADFREEDDLDCLLKNGGLAVRYVDNWGKPATIYPANPNGSPGGAAGFCSADGRVTILMPHPERVFRSAQHSWCPSDWGEDGPWMRMFRNARVWID